MHIPLFSKFLNLGLESVVMDHKIELNRSKNLGLDIKYTPFELVYLMESQFQILLFFDKIHYVLHELYLWAWFLWTLTMGMSSLCLKHRV